MNTQQLKTSTTMKKILVIIASLCLSVAAFATGSTSISVNSTAGGLATAISTAGGDLSTVTNLTVTGEIDARDFETMRADMSALTDIDLSGASVVAYASYAANEIPSYAFRYKRTLKAVVLPNSVTSIASGVFRECNGLTSVVLPSIVTSIGEYAFASCTNLSTINLPNSLTSISKGVFYDCSSLSAISIPSSVTSIADFAFDYCTGLASIDISSSVALIGYGAFYKCINLNTINLPSSLTVIKDYAFRDCDGLTSINIPSSVTTIGYGAFSGCTGLSSVSIPASVISLDMGEFPRTCKITVDANNPNYCTEDDILYNKAKTQLIFCPIAKAGAVNLPSTLTSIPNSAFSDCIGISSVSIPNLITSIPDETFSGCTGLTSINIPNSVTSIGNHAFSNCESLSTINLSSSLTTIGSYAFYNCQSLSTIDIPSSVTSIDYYAFDYTTSLQSIFIASKSITLFQNIFTSLPKADIYIDSENLKLINYNWNLYCRALVSHFSEKIIFIENPFLLKGFASRYEFDSSNQNYSSDGLVVFDKNKTELIVASRSCYYEYKIPSTVTKIDNGAFSVCDTLKTIIIPASVTAIGDTAFSRCYSLSKIYSYAVNPVSLPAKSYGYFGVFYGVDTTTCILYVPKGSKAAYQAADQWKEFKNIVEMDENTAAATNANQTALKVQVRNGKLIVDGAAEDMDVAVYNMQGIQVASTKASGAELEINLPCKGIYVLRVGTQSMKVLN